MWCLRAPPIPECLSPRYMQCVADSGVAVVPTMAEARRFNDPAAIFQFMREHPAVEGWTLVRVV